MKPPSASWNVYQPDAPELAPLGEERVRDRGRLREQEALDVEDADPLLPGDEPEHEHEDRGNPVAAALVEPAQVSLGDRLDGSRLFDERAHAAWSASRTSGHELEEARLLARVRGARLRQVDRDELCDPPRPRRHHDDAGREEDGLGDRVGDEDDGRARRLPDPQELHVEALARHLVERAERLVHQQERRVEGERPRDRDALLHPARELPRMVVLEALQLDELEHLRDAVAAALLAPARRARAGARCSSRRCASRRGRRPGTRSRSRGRGAPAATASRSRAPRRRSARSGRRSRAGASTCRSRTGRSARRTRRGRSRDRSPGARSCRREGLRHARTDTAAALGHATCSGARRTTSRSTRTTTRKKMIPSSAAMMFVAQRSAGSIE